MRSVIIPLDMFQRGHHMGHRADRSGPYFLFIQRLGTGLPIASKMWSWLLKDRHTSSEMYPSCTPHLLVAWGRKRVRSTDDRLQEALKVRDEDVALRGHISQLTQTVNQLSLPPSEEESKKKGWWQFWK